MTDKLKHVGHQRSRKDDSSGPFGCCCSSVSKILCRAVRRLFSTFAHGAPGVGLLLLRLASGVALVSDALTSLRGHLPVGPTLFDVFMSAVGILLLVGLWTPIAGS